MPTEHEDSLVELLTWLASRWQGLFPQLRRPPARRIRGLPSATDAPDTPQRQAQAIAQLMAQMNLQPPRWVAQPDELRLPMLAHVEHLGWGVLVGRTGGRWRFETPARTHALEAFPQGCGFAALVPQAEPQPGQAGHAGEGGEGHQARAIFRAALAAHRAIFIWAAVAALAGNVLALGASLYSMQIYDRVLPTQGVSTLVVLTVGVLMAIALELFIKLARSAVLEHAVKSMDITLSHQIFERLLAIRMDQLPGSVGTLSSQLRSYESVRAFMSTATMYFAVDAPFALLFIGVIALLAGPLVAAVPLAFLCLAVCVGLLYRGRIAHFAATGNSLTNQKLGLLVETVENAETVKAYGSGWRQQTRWDHMERDAVEGAARMRHYSEQAAYISGFLQQASYVGLVGVGAYLAVSANALTAGSLIACSILSGRILAPVAQLPGIIVQWANARIALQTLEKVFALEQDNHGVAQPLAPERFAGAYEATRLSFTYPGQPPLLDIQSLRIRPGEKVAILGPVGAGKSTLLKLLAGLYRPAGGQLLLDGLDLHHISRAHLSERIGYCPQDARLFAGTLRDNLLAGLHGVPEAHLLQACRATGLAATIAGHPKGLDLEIHEGGAGVSGGQKQVVTLTRALLSKPDLWLLDEPTASMDETTEARCLLALREAIGKEQTLVVVTHKPVLLSLVDRIVILEPRRGIVLDGPRDEVLRQLRQRGRPGQPAPSVPPAAKVVPMPLAPAATAPRSPAEEVSP